MADTELRDRIIDTAIELAEQRSWEAVRLHDVAAMLDIDLDQVRQHFREKEDLTDGWFDRADSAMLRASQAPEFQTLPTRDRLQHLIMAWLSALAPHRKVTREMIYGKLEPGHLHIQVPGLMRVSRTVQWIREAAHRDATFVRRALEETGLTSIYLMTFFYWMRDDSAESVATSRFLERWLTSAERLNHRIFARGPVRPPPSQP